MNLTDRAFTLVQKLLSRPEIKAIEAEERRLVFAKRTALAQEEAVLKDRALHLVRAHEKALVPKEDAVRACEAALDTARRAVLHLHGEHRQVMFPISQRLDRIASELFQTRQAEAIDAFATEMQAALEATYRRSRTLKDRNIRGYVVDIWSNWASVHGRAEAIVAAIRAARACATEALDDAQLTAKFDALRATLPDLEDPPADILERLNAPRWESGALRA